MPVQPVTFRLEDVRGVRPVILVFAPSVRSPAYENQVTLLEQDEVASRTNAVLVLILAEGTSSIDGERLDETSAEELRTSFAADEGSFLVILFGADGTERHRDDTPLQPAAIEHRLTDAPGRKS